MMVRLKRKLVRPSAVVLLGTMLSMSNRMILMMIPSSHSLVIPQTTMRSMVVTSFTTSSSRLLHVTRQTRGGGGGGQDDLPVVSKTPSSSWMMNGLKVKRSSTKNRKASSSSKSKRMETQATSMDKLEYASVATLKSQPQQQQRPPSAAASAAAASTPQRSKVLRQQQQQKQQTTTKRESKRNPEYYSRSDLLEHELLTAKEEQELGQQMKHAMELRQTIHRLWRNDEHQQNLSQPTNSMRQQDESSQNKASTKKKKKINKVERGKVNIRSLDNFRGQSQTEERYNAGYPGQDELDDDDDDSDDHTFPLNRLTGYGMGGKALMEYDQGSLLTMASYRSADDQASNGAMEPIPLDSRTILDDLHLTDEDIIQKLNVAGGRKELTQILIQGALARDKLIRSNIRLVVSIAKKWAKQTARGVGSVKEQQLVNIYAGSWTRPSLDEAIQEGILGLAIAADRFEPGRQLKFGTYATYWITSYIRNCYQSAQTGCLRIPPNYHVAKQKYLRLAKSYYRIDGSLPPIEKIAAEMEMTVERLQFILRTSRSLLSIDAPSTKSNDSWQGGKAGSIDLVTEDKSLRNSIVWYVR